MKIMKKVMKIIKKTRKKIYGDAVEPSKDLADRNKKKTRTPFKEVSWLKLLFIIPKTKKSEIIKGPSCFGKRF